MLNAFLLHEGEGVKTQLSPSQWKTNIHQCKSSPIASNVVLWNLNLLRSEGLGKLHSFTSTTHSPQNLSCSLKLTLLHTGHYALWLLHSPAISTVLGSPLQPRLHLHHLLVPFQGLPPCLMMGRLASFHYSPNVSVFMPSNISNWRLFFLLFF